MSIQRHTVIHEGPGGPFESTAFFDPSTGVQPGLLLFPNFLGAQQSYSEIAEYIAGLGYKVLEVDFYGRGKRASDGETATKLMGELVSDRAVMRDRLLDALTELRNLPGVDSAKVGAIGFCLGGKCVLDLARAGADIAGGVVFHGVYDRPPFPNATMTAKLLICHGWNDPLCPPDATAGLAQELTEADVDWQLIAYGRTGHAFTAQMPMNEARSFGFQPDANRRSFQAMENFLAEVFA